MRDWFKCYHSETSGHLPVCTHSLLSSCTISALSMSGMCCMLCVASGALTYTNVSHQFYINNPILAMQQGSYNLTKSKYKANTITYGGYLNLMKRQLQLSFNFISKRIHSGPMSAVTAILAFLSLYFAIKGYISPAFSYFELELEEEKEQNKRLNWKRR